MSTDWNKLMIPQPDNYDSEILLKLARERFGTPTEESSSDYKYSELPDGVGGNFKSVPDHEHIDQIEHYMELWPEGWKGFNTLLDKVYPLESIPFQRPAPMGSTSGHRIGPDGTLGTYVTFGNVEGAVAGLWHEFGHLRLHSLGIRMETFTDQFFLNSPESRYVSSIRKDSLRPISACLHGFYAWTLLSEGQLKFENVDQVSCFLCMNIFKIEEGLETLKEHAVLTDIGKQLMYPLYDFAEDLAVRVRAALGDRLTEDHRKRFDEWKSESPVPSDHLYAEIAK